MSRHLTAAYDDPVASLRGSKVGGFGDSIKLILRVRAASLRKVS